MPGSKFMVIKLRELMKTAVFAVLGVAIIVALIYFAVGRLGDRQAVYNPGVYSSQIELQNGNVLVEVKVGKTKIQKVTVSSDSETVPVFYPLFNTVAEDIGKQVVKQQTTQLEIEGDGSVTTALILDAVEESLAQARK
ncbi:MAG: hypothetical protein VB018_07295 [Lachnospiraceae bacterium]|nr:hypothetical protein [Lachnospiraceae bacterium]